MDRAWLVDMFLEAGLADEDARKAADACLVRLLKRERPGAGGRRRPAIMDHLVRDPLVSLNRIIGKGDEGLPFVDAETRRLSSVMFGHTVAEAGLDSAVAIAYSKVIAEAYEPEELYQPVWEALGHTGQVDLETLRRQDWSPLRAQFMDLLGPNAASDQQPTVQVRAKKPKAEPPDD